LINFFRRINIKFHSIFYYEKTIHVNTS